jgi:NDP-sugar pyrophosphorylase family protein
MDRLPAGVSDTIADAYIPALLAGSRIQSFEMTGYFAEHSTPQRYLEGNLALLRDPALFPAPPGPLTGVDERATVEPGAVLIPPLRIAEGARIASGAVVGPEAVIGRNARIASGARVERSVVWDGATVTGPVADQVIVRRTGDEA